jgi:hypothetical protein
MAEDDKILKTGDLRVKRDASGNRYMKYVDEDERHGVRPEDQWEDVDLKVRQFFGYDTWEEYSADNQSDLTRNVQRDEDGKVVAAPTLWPFHVAYTLEEFKENLDGEKYAVVGVPKNPELQKRTGVALAIKIAQARREYFKPGGVLDRGMKNPRETLDNQELIDRAKKNLDFDSAFNAKLANKAVQHPETIQTKRETGHELYWAENIGNYRDVASREDMGDVFGFPVLTEPKRVDTGALQKNEEGKILLESTLDEVAGAVGELASSAAAAVAGTAGEVSDAAQKMAKSMVNPSDVTQKGGDVAHRLKSGIFILDLSQVKDVSGLPSSGLTRYYVLEPGPAMDEVSAQQLSALIDALRVARDDEGNTTVNNIRLHDEDGNVDTDKTLEYLIQQRRPGSEGLRFLQPTRHIGEKFKVPLQVAGKGMALKQAKELQEHHTRLRTDPLYAEKEAEDSRFEEEWLLTGAEILDPTGILSIPFLVQSYQEFTRNKSLSNFGYLTLGVFSVLPVVGFFARAGSRAVRGLTKIPLDSAGMKKLDNLYDEFAKKVDEAPRIGKNVRQHKIYQLASKEFLGAADVIEKSLANVKNGVKALVKSAKTGDNLIDEINRIYRKEINITKNHIGKLEGLKKQHGGAMSAQASAGIGTTILRLRNHLKHLQDGQTMAKKTFSELLNSSAVDNIIEGSGFAIEKWDDISTFFKALKKTDNAKLAEILSDPKKYKKLGLTDEAAAGFQKMLDAIDDPARLKNLLKGLRKATKGKSVLKYLDDLSRSVAVLARVIRKGVEVQGTFDIPDMPVTEVDFLLLPSTWYLGTVLTDGEILVRERLMIKGPARAAVPTRRKEEEPEVIELEPAPEEREDVIVPGEEPSDNMFMQGTTPGVETPPSTLDPDMDLAQGRGVRDKFENYPWTAGNPYVVGQGTGAAVIDGPGARVWEFDNAKDKVDEYFEGVKIDAEDFQVGPTTDQKEWPNVYPWAADPYNETPEQDNPHVEGDTPPRLGPLWEPAIRWEVTNRPEKWQDFKNTDFAKSYREGGWEDLEQNVGIEDTPEAPVTDQPEDKTPEITKNEKLAEENEVGKWTPALFGAEKFDQQLVDNIVALQKQLGFEGDEIDGLAGEGTLKALYRLLNRKYKFNDDQLKKFKEEIANGKTSEEAAKSVIDSDESLSERSLAAIEKQMSTSPDKKPTRSPLKQFEGTGNVKIIDPRTAFAHPKIHKWLSGLEGSWVVGDISLPFGGGSHPTSTEKSRSRDYEGTSFSYDKVRFNHTRHKFGTHVDFQIPLKQGGFNAWDTKVDAEEIDFEKVLNLLQQAKASGLKFSVVMDAEHIEKLKEEFEKQLKGISLIKNDNHRDHIHIQFPPSQKNLRANKRHFLSFDWFEAEAKTIIEKNKGTARKENWKPVLFGSKTFDTNLVQNIWKFQEYTGLFPDGVAGEKTVKRLKYLITKNKQLAKKYKWEPKDFGAEKFDINLIYKIFEYQSKNNLKADGKAGKGTIKSKSARANISENKILEFLFKFTDEVENELV